MRLLLVEDEDDFAQAILQVLQREGYVVDWVNDGYKAWVSMESQWTDYDLAIIDWMLPGLNGLEVCHRLRQAGRSLPVLLLTALGEPENKVRGLDAGADDYLVKPFVMSELLARLRALRRRSSTFHPDDIVVSGFTLDRVNHALTSVNCDGNNVRVELTGKEFQLVEYLMLHAGRIVSGSKLRQQIWSLSEDPVSNVVAAQVRLIRRKISASGCSSPIETVPSQGYRFRVDA